LVEPSHHLWRSKMIRNENMKTKLLTLILITIPFISLFSQSNEELDRFLGQEYADLKTTVWLVYISSGELPLEAVADEAMESLLASEHARRFVKIPENSPIKYGEFALLMMDLYDLPGGLMYHIIPSPRYAAREFTSRRWMPGNPEPGSFLTPWEVTSALSQVLAWKEVQ